MNDMTKALTPDNFHRADQNFNLKLLATLPIMFRFILFRCMVPLSQDAAYDVLLEICINNCDGLKSVADKLITWHHSSVDTTEWEYMPPVEGRASSGTAIADSATNTY